MPLLSSALTSNFLLQVKRGNISDSIGAQSVPVIVDHQGLVTQISTTT